MHIGLNLSLTGTIIVSGAAPGGGGGGELITNGSFATTDNWTGDGEIAGGNLTFVETGTEEQTIVAGEQPAGDYVGTIDITSNGAGVQVTLAGGVGVGDELFAGGVTGVGLPVTITASGPWTRCLIGVGDTAVIAAVSLQAA
jgi:hypothetical protein